MFFSATLRHPLPLFFLLILSFGAIILTQPKSFELKCNKTQALPLTVPMTTTQPDGHQKPPDDCDPNQSLESFSRHITRNYASVLTVMIYTVGSIWDPSITVQQFIEKLIIDEQISNDVLKKIYRHPGLGEKGFKDLIEKLISCGFIKGKTFDELKKIASSKARK